MKTFYNSIQSCVINNGVSSNFFTLDRGVRQGDPLSPYLFIIAVETLAIAIRQKESIRGITIGTEETKLLQFADDTTAVLADTSSAARLVELLNKFEILSGLKINCSKTDGMWIGSKRHSKEKPFGIKWPDEPIKALHVGVYFTYDQKLLKRKEFYRTINLWSARGLSIYGKVTIIKSFLMPKYIYICSIPPTPKELLKELNKILLKFLWKGVDKVTRVSVINEYEEGGVRMVDLECMVKSLRLAWLKRIFSGTNGTWKNYLQHILSSVGGLFFFKLQLQYLGLHNYFSILLGTFVMVVAIS